MLPVHPKPKKISVRPKSEPMSETISQQMHSQIVGDIFNLINNQLTTDLYNMRAQITKDVLCEVKEYISKEIAETMRKERTKNDSNMNNVMTNVRNEIANVKNEVSDVGKQIVTAGNKHLTITKKLTQEVANAVSKQVHASVIDEINQTLVPELNRMSQWVQYSTEDTTDMITNYRRAVHRQANKEDNLMISSGDPEKDKLANFQKELMFFTDRD